MWLFVTTQIPCNIALQRVYPESGLPHRSILMFGVTPAMQALIRNRTGFLISRLVLGFCASRYIPGAIYTLSTWYTQKELEREGNAISSLLATGILKLDHIRGLRGWQWLCLLEGLLTIVVACVIILLLSESNDKLKLLLSPGVVRYSELDTKMLHLRLESDDSGKPPGAQGIRFSLGVVWSMLCHWRRWPHKSLGLDPITANALAAVGAFLALIVIFCFLSISDRTNFRGGTVIAAQLCYLAILLIARQVHPHIGPCSRWGLWTAVDSFAVGYHPVHNIWLQVDCATAAERSISIAMWVMSAITVGVVFAVLQLVIYAVHNRRINQGDVPETQHPISRLYVLWSKYVTR
ncbi:major facilitator superfamily domain-containing protein [Cercophora scortea]|uniref:Major facilitator superfamily domain-containing protein n=1 Tax=Cercophora scortea TaxID=314031 RepID=A0AAE0I6G4_9PEZI|nr:major facilitator superfamily domain-containing protein [Cercophora scortea]